MKSNISPKLKAVLDGIDMANYGFSADAGFGLAENFPAIAAAANAGNVQAASLLSQLQKKVLSAGGDFSPAMANRVLSPVNGGGMGQGNSINKSIADLTRGTSTAILQIKVAVAGSGAGNDYNPVFLFGSDAYSNASKGYTVVQLNNPVQVTANAFGTDNKNVITIKYGTDPNSVTYTITQKTKGEYPFWMSSLNSDREQIITAMQLTVNDAAFKEQLKNSVQIFELDQFGKATTNDLTQPQDLYQFNSDGLWITNPAPISGKKGLIFNVNEEDGMVLDLYLSVL